MTTKVAPSGAHVSRVRSIACARARWIAISMSQLALVVGCAPGVAAPAADAGPIARADAAPSAHDAAVVAPRDASSAPDAFVAADAGPPECDCFDGTGTYCEADVAT